MAHVRLLGADRLGGDRERRRRHQSAAAKLRIRNPKSAVAVALSTVAILVATLHRAGSSLPAGWSLALASGDTALAEIIQNLLLFIPFGASLAWAGVRPRRAILLGAGLSFSVEFLQQWIPGRDPSLGDIVCNTLSTAIGVALARATPRRSTWLALATAGAAVTVWLATGLLLRPIAPPPPYELVPRPDFDFWGQYRGAIVSVDSGSPIQFTATFPSRPPGRRSPLVALLDPQQRRVLMVIADRRDISVRYLTPAALLTLEQPDLRWRGGLARLAPGDTFTVRTWRGELGTCLTVNHARRCGLGYTIGDGWKLIFYPEHFPAWLLAALNALWVAGWVLGVGYWGSRGTAMGIALAGLIVVPSIAGLNATPLHEWLGAIGGMAIGYWRARS